MQSGTMNRTNLVAVALCKMDGNLSGMTMSKVEMIVKEKQSLNFKKEDATGFP